MFCACVLLPGLTFRAREHTYTHTHTHTGMHHHGRSPQPGRLRMPDAGRLLHRVAPARDCVLLNNLVQSLQPVPECMSRDLAEICQVILRWRAFMPQQEAGIDEPCSDSDGNLLHWLGLEGPAAPALYRETISRGARKITQGGKAKEIICEHGCDVRNTTWREGRKKSIGFSLF